jgi:hypothetical protein
MVRTTAYSPENVQEIRNAFSELDPNIAVGETGAIATLLEQDYFARPRFLPTTTSTLATIVFRLDASGSLADIAYSLVTVIGAEVELP